MVTEKEEKDIQFKALKKMIDFADKIMALEKGESLTFKIANKEMRIFTRTQ